MKSQLFEFKGSEAINIIYILLFIYNLINLPLQFDLLSLVSITPITIVNKIVMVK